MPEKLTCNKSNDVHSQYGYANFYLIYEVIIQDLDEQLFII